MALNPPLDNGKPNACPFKFLFAVQSLKSSKQFICISNVKPDPVVFDIIDILFLVFTATNFNNRLISGPHELDCIGNEIKKDLVNQSRISSGRWKGFNVYLYLPFRSKGINFSKNFPCQPSHVYLYCLDLLATYPGKDEKVIYEFTHLLCVFQNYIQQTFAFLIKFIHIIFQKHTRETNNSSQGCPQVMRNRI